ncbi:hypothetical protein OSTOST_00165 [Ostertagia ostertagi]
MDNTSGVGAGVRGEVNSIFGNNGTAGVYGVASGTGGYGGYFEHSSATGFGLALLAANAGQGRTAQFQTSLNTNTQPTITASTVGLGGAAAFLSNNTSSTANIVNVTANGPGVIADHSTGNAVQWAQEEQRLFSSNNSSSTANILNVTANGPGVIADHSTGNAGNFFMDNTSGVGAGVRGEVNSIFGNNGTAGVYGVASGTGGYGGYFEHSSATGFGVSLQAVNLGQGAVMILDQQGSGTDIARFRTGGLNRARIDRTGRGFFNGGTQNSGADLAEAFDVKGQVNNYEPGDVLAIAVDADRTVQKSQQAYSNLVVGVYATKPGVLLTEESAVSNLEDKVPMGVVGVIPTKVCNENGAIRRGDMLVSASRPGYAMKADLSRLQPGQAIDAKVPVRSTDNAAKLATTTTAGNKLPLRTTNDAAKAVTVVDAEKLPVRSTDPAPVAAPSGASQKAAAEKKTTLPSEKPAPSGNANKAVETIDKAAAPAQS